MTARIPVFIRVGDILDSLVGSVAVEPVPGSPDKVRIADGSLGMADLLDAVATEIRRKAGHPKFANTTLLIAASEHDAKDWQRRYPGRWTDACPISDTVTSALEGCRITVADVTPAALASEHLDSVVEVVERNIVRSVPSGARVGVGYLLEPQ